MSPHDVDNLLTALDGRQFESPSEALIALGAATEAINDTLQPPPGDLSLRSVGISAAASRERLEQWIGRLSDIAASVAKQFDALSYSVGVGLPAGVSVSVTWSAGR